MASAVKEISAREQAQILGLARAGIGAGMFLFPSLAARVWLSAPAKGSVSRVTMKALGAREVVLGIGTLMALEGRGEPSAWVEAGALCDVADTYLVATTKGIPLHRRIASIAISASAAYIGIKAAEELD
jgi:hypothetical protein